MKRILMICAAIVAIIVMVSCSKGNEELIVGKWRIQSEEGIAVQTISDGSGDVQTEEIVYVDSWGWVFNADGTGYAYEIMDGQEIETGQFTYTIDDEMLHMPAVDFQIVKLNRRKLRVYDKVEMSDADGNFLQYEYGYWDFKRQ